MLPNREDVGTVWEFFDRGEIKGLESNDGLEIVFGQSYISGSAYAPTLGEVNIFKFDSPENSKMHFDERVSGKIEKGGFEEVKINAPDADCYGAYYPPDLLQEIVVYTCVKDNVYVFVRVLTSSFDGERQAEDFMRIVLDKI